MKPSPRLALTALTHVLALTCGWAIYQAAGSRRTEISTEVVATGRTKAAARPAPATKASREILATVLKAASENPMRAITSSYYEGVDGTVPQTPREILDRIGNVGIPADFAAAIEALMPPTTGYTRSEEDHAEAVALIFHWLLKDPRAFFEWTKTDSRKNGIAQEAIMKLGPELYRRLGAAGVLPLLAMTTDFKDQIRADLALSIAKNGDAAGVSEAKAVLGADSQDWKTFARYVGIHWPDDKLAALVKLAVECDEPIIAIGHKIYRDQGAYIAGLLADQSLPEDFRRRISENRFAREGLARDPKVPLETRLQNGGNFNQLLKNDVGRLLTEDRDWAFAFRQGAASAQEIMDIVAAGTPDLAKREPDALWMLVFRELAEENPADAMTLLKDLPEDERNNQALYVSRTHFNDVEPDKFLELLQQVPADTPEQWEGRLDAWNLRSFTNHGRLQDGYVEWVQALPPGLDREMGLYSLARVVNESNPKLAANLRSQVTNPDLQQRISKHR